MPVEITEQAAKKLATLRKDFLTLSEADAAVLVGDLRSKRRKPPKLMKGSKSNGKKENAASEAVQENSCDEI